MKENPVWNGEGIQFKELCESIGEEKDYYQMFKVSSKFVHGSPIVKNMYFSEQYFGALTNSEHLTGFNCMCAIKILSSLKNFCNFFGVEYNETELYLVQMRISEVHHP